MAASLFPGGLGEGGALPSAMGELRRRQESSGLPPDGAGTKLQKQPWLRSHGQGASHSDLSFLCKAAVMVFKVSCDMT